MAHQMKHDRDNAMQQELNRIEQAAQATFDKKDAAYGYARTPAMASLTNSTTMGRGRNPGGASPSDMDMGYMKPRKTAGGIGTYSLEDMRNEEKDPVWSAHYDEDAQEIYYYNRKTNVSQWDWPTNFDGYEIMAGKSANRFGDEEAKENYDRTFGVSISHATFPDKKVTE